MIDQQALRDWIERRKRKLQQQQQQASGSVTLPNGLQIHIHLPQQHQKMPLTPDGKSLSVRDTVARYPS